jgi:hypothetical protein
MVGLHRPLRELAWVAAYKIVRRFDVAWCKSHRFKATNGCPSEKVRPELGAPSRGCACPHQRACRCERCLGCLGDPTRVAITDTCEQTAAVFRALAQEAHRDEIALTRWQALQTWIASGPSRVSIPFAHRLAELCIERLAPVRKGRPITFDLPDIERGSNITKALGVIAKAMAAGELTPDEAGTVATVIEAHRKAIETAEFQERLRKLEARLGQ